MILDDIALDTRKRINEIDDKVKKTTKKQALALSSFTDFPFSKSLSHPGLSFIAEVKKASPSKGLISKDFNPVEIAKEYEKINIDAISVLTEPNFFQGSIEYLKEIKKKVNIPLLRKDFIIDTFQIYEAKVSGANAILLICALLEHSDLANYYNIATSLGLDVLVEVHNREELDKALSIKAKIIGINNRDLYTFNVDLSTTETLRKFIPTDTIVVSESGYFNRSDIIRAEKSKVDAVLIGESFMISLDKDKHLKELKGLR
ncbi:MAG: indole-3-glycerol phosphate synthase TrpC [Spirochaetaceae bacterium]|nr:indole-3-glycerol phosphate synthase TrpC [Spirochaetaceae bacterium]